MLIKDSVSHLDVYVLCSLFMLFSVITNLSVITYRSDEKLVFAFIFK